MDRLAGTEVFGRPSGGQVTGNRRDDIPTVEGRTDNFRKQGTIGHTPHGNQMALDNQLGEQTVIRAKKAEGLGSRKNDIPLAAYTGVHHHDMQGLLGEITVSGSDHGRRLADIVGGDLMAEINDHRLGRPAQNSAPQNAGIFVPVSEIGQQRYRG
jgi:hypothetical protein